ncbi:acetolactate synthase small subunit [Terrilactibacillus laevilacticus]|uniref:Acetolactate synthase small subunit n=1 Tax=Terrilactibacillus laevilacticus TaxID=1380157 RepID=A0ABW5PSE1_9BACI|nr:acetolactate synthase small subunit [Terrilactibacillus laevilacticus]
MKKVVHLLTNNETSALSRILGVLSKRQCQVESLSVTSDVFKPHFSNVTLVTDVRSEEEASLLIKQLDKLIDVVEVKDLSIKGGVARELALVKVVSPSDIRSEIISLAEPFRASIIDVSRDALTFELTGKSEKIDAFIELVKPYGIKEVSRTGAVAFIRNDKEDSSSKEYSLTSN